MTITEGPSAPPEDDDLGGDGANGRMCIVTRESGSADELIRFVAAPDGTVVPDLKRQLPGRGCWVKLDRALVDKAVAKKLFARALKAEVTAPGDLGAIVDRLLVAQLAGMMHMARKAASSSMGRRRSMALFAMDRHWPCSTRSMPLPTASAK